MLEQDEDGFTQDELKQLAARRASWLTRTHANAVADATALYRYYRCHCGECTGVKLVKLVKKQATAIRKRCTLRHSKAS